MNAAGAIAVNDEMREAYDVYDYRIRSRGLIAAAIIGMVCMPGGVVLDYFLYKDKVWQFLGIRMGVDVVMGLIAAALWFGRDRIPLKTVKLLGVVTGLVFNAAFCLMIYITTGAQSPYYAGLNLIITGMTVLLPWTMKETLSMCLGSLLMYVAACVAHANFFHPDSFKMFAFSGFFITITMVVCLSITHIMSRRRYEDFRLRHQLDIQNKELQDLDRVKTQFFSNVSHELRTPLTLILGPVETMLSKSDQLEEKLHENLLYIHRNTLRLLKLINDLLDLTRLDQGADMLRKKNFMLGTFTKGIVDSVRHLGLSKQLKIKVEEGDTKIRVQADPVRLEKVLVNLLTNAIKYTPQGGSINVRWANGSNETKIEVSDTGVGIPEEDLPRIFDRFHQVRSNAANQTQGVGIGLALAKELVEEHKGRLEVESIVGTGTTFRVVLPVEQNLPESEPDTLDSAPADAPAAAEEPFEKAFRSADRTWRSFTDEGALPIMGKGQDVVLVADDETDMRRYIVSLLSEQYRVVQTQHGGNVRDLVAEHEPSVVLLDWMMPVKDGLEVCRELRKDERNRDLKIVMVTARIDEQSKIEALQSGADDFLTKPFSSIEVRTRIANLLRSAQLQRSLRMRNEELSQTIAKLQQTETMLIQSEKMNAIGSMSAGLLHEINNPLNYTLTAIRFAARFKDSLKPEMLEILADVEEGMTRIRDVITHLKNFAYPEKAGTESIFTLDEVFSAAKKIVAGELEDIRVDVDLPDSLLVRGQKTQLTHLFINLLNNAGKALKENGADGPKVITVKGAPSGENAVVEVWDNGPGIKPEIIGRIFEPFFTTRQVGAGMGLGLSICHTIMEAHRGSIRAANRPEGGAIFTINLPLSEEALKLC